MAKNRDLAQIVYASTLGKASSARIWKTVVVAGAMLGAPLTAAAEAPPVKQDVPAKQETKPAGKATAPAGKPVAPPAAMPVAPPPVDRAEEAKNAKAALKAVEAENKENEAAIKDATARLKKAKTPEDKAAHTATLDEAKKKKPALAERIKVAKADAKKADDEARAEARAKNPPRPRVQESRPMGRGFILS